MGVNEKNVICFELFGSFSLGNKETKEHTTLKKAGKKVLSFLQYLIINHKRSISTEELIEQFWPETDSSDPGNALKNMMFRTRTYLKQIFPEQEELIQKRPGCYIWNPDVKVEVDAERFEQGYLEARRKTGEDRIRKLLQILSLYRGDFLSGNDSDWAVSIRHYYQTLYLDVCKDVLPALQEEERWMEIIGICEQACIVDFSIDMFVVYHMQALMALGQPERAVERYQIFRKALWQEYEFEPAAQVEQIYMLAVSMCRGGIGGQDILKLVTEGEEEKGAFFCTFEIFCSIVARERRHLARSQQSSTLFLVSLGDQAVSMTDVRRLQRVLAEGLRTGDLVARLDAGSYIVMLTGATVENTRDVICRVEQRFQRTCISSNARIHFRMSALEPLAVQ